MSLKFASHSMRIVILPSSIEGIMFDMGVD